MSQTQAELNKLIASAQTSGIELDETEAQRWLDAMSGWQEVEEIKEDKRTGVFGHAISMLDFSPKELSYFRKVGKIVEFEDEPGVETALALSGSSAQSKIQAYPGDCDYFERINIHAETKEDACRVLSRLIREKVANFKSGPTFQLVEVRFGSFPQDVVVDGVLMRAGSSIAWTVPQVEAGQITAVSPDGEPVTILWDDVALDPGWTKLDWIIADPIHGRLANASNMLDVTWEAPDGSITPLDGYLDAYFQEVYLDIKSVPIFTKLSQHVSSNALDDYVRSLEKEVKKYVSRHPENFGKAAKRMYNIFRLTGRYQEAAFIRELFDEPASMLYQVGALIRTIDEALTAGQITLETIQAQAQQLITQVVEVLEGVEETEIVTVLMQLYEALMAKQPNDAEWKKRVSVARDAVMNRVNNFFYDKLTAVPTIKTYINTIKTS